MLKMASTMLGMSPHQAMQTAERMYLSGYITYPRTETSEYPKNFDLRDAVHQQTKSLAPHESWHQGGGVSLFAEYSTHLKFG